MVRNGDNTQSCGRLMQLAVDAYLDGETNHKATAIDLPGFLSSCELNYHKLLKVFPSLKAENCRQIELHFVNQDTARLELQVLERTTHTSKLSLSLFDQNAYVQEAEMQIRVYHDMRVVEVLSVQSIDVRKSSIRKSKNGVLRPSERLQASALLCDWLGHCLSFGTVPFAFTVE